MMIFNSKDVFLGRSLLNYGEYSQEESNLYITLIKPGSTAVEVGAGCGYFTNLISRIVGPSGRVLAFEPERNNFHLLCGNIAINDILNVRCFQNALSKENGQINVPEIDLNTTINSQGIKLGDDFQYTYGYWIPKNKLDDFYKEKVDFMKIDVEGMELDVLKGSLDTIKNSNPIVYLDVELIQNKDEVISFFKNLNYTLYFHRPFLFSNFNFFENKENIFIKEDKCNYISENILAFPNGYKSEKDLSCFNLIEIK